MKRLISVAAFAVFMLVFVSDTLRADTDYASANKPVYYLSLGTSLAAGVQADQTTGESVITRVSYPSVLADMMSRDIRKLHHVNLGCPGETATTLMLGGICEYEERSQLDQALQFLHAHGKFTGLITIDLGANDMLQCVDGVVIDETCLVDTLNQLGSDLFFILQTLREAAPEAAIVGMNYYNPLAAYWFDSPQIAHQTVDLQMWINSVLQNVYDSLDIPVADVAAAFMSYDLSTDKNLNNIPDSIEMLCGLTWMCDFANIHANDAGYGVIAEQFYNILPAIPASGPPRKNK